VCRLIERFFFHDLEEFRSQTLLTNRIHIYEGCVEETIDRFLFECPGIRVSMLFFDLDLYEPTKFALQRLWPLLVAGGVAVFDQYGFKEFPGESKAVDEFFAGREVLESFPWCANPAAFIIKK